MLRRPIFLICALVCVEACAAFTTVVNRRNNDLLTKSRFVIEGETVGIAKKNSPRPSFCRDTTLSSLPISVSALLATPVKSSVILAAAVALLVNAKRILWPRALRDPSFSAPLPPGSLGCPFLGRPFFLGSKDFGAGDFYRRASRALNNSKLFKFYFLGIPFVAMAGADNIKDVLNKEFDPKGIKVATRVSGGGAKMMGQESLIAEQDKGKHQFLRRLVGQSMTPAAVARSIPTLQAAAESQAEKLLSASKKEVQVCVDKICNDYTLDVAWDQILGLKLKEDEIETFHEAVMTWIGGVTSFRVLANWRVASSPGYKARLYLESKIEEKISDLEKNGPDASTLSGMVFATDDEASEEGRPARKLTRRQIIDNAMLLILAGSETSASTLTNAMLFLGLQPSTWKKLVEEQNDIQSKYGETLTKEVIDKECPYLEAVVKEAMRLKPVSGGIPRIVQQTMEIDGKQIPKGWLIDWSMVLTHQLDSKTYKEDGSHMDVVQGFVPERWLNEETKPAEFIPMGAGPRYCLGGTLAYAEMKVFLAVLARKLDFDLTGQKKNIQWKRMSIIPKAEDGVPIRVRKRTPSKLQLA